MVKKLLLTGATGYLGSNLLKEFVLKGYDVTILKRSTSSLARIEKFQSKAKFINIDEEGLESIFVNNSFDGVIHTATSYGRKNESLEEILESNLTFPISLLNKSVQHKVSFFLNTDTSLPSDVNSYSLSKSQFVEWLKCQSKNIKIINMIPEYFYGEYDDQTKFITSVLRKMQMEVASIDFTLGTQKRDFIYIADMISAYSCVLDNIDEFSNFTDIPVGYSSSKSLKEIVALIKLLTGNNLTKLNFGKIAMRGGEIMDSKADISILRSLGWKPRYSIAAGLNEIIKIENNKKSHE